MTPTRQGSIRLFRFAGIDLYLHWSWFLVAAYEATSRTGGYSSALWNVLEYLTLFLIVTLHEFGHALACRQVGGHSDQIVLWPLGGVAYVSPPQRPGATLWSIAAGPMVNVALVPILTTALLVFGSLGGGERLPDAYAFLHAILYMNWFLLIFNLLPVYPLDGGQIVRSLLWFVVGRSRSLMVASIIGFLGVAVLLLLAVLVHSTWVVILSVFIVLNCWRGLQQARLLARADRIPRHAGFACPDCQAAPPVGAVWICGRCQNRFDTFVTGAICPQCLEQYSETKCFDCGSVHPMSQWIVPLA